MELLQSVFDTLRSQPSSVLFLGFLAILAAATVFIYTTITFVAPIPRPPIPSEKTYKHVDSDGRVSTRNPLPCWYDSWSAQKEATRSQTDADPEDIELEPAELLVSVVVPAYNEEDRLKTMLAEAVEYLEKQYPNPTTTGQPASSAKASKPRSNGSASAAAATKSSSSAHPLSPSSSTVSVALPKGWEIVIVSDGSTDATETVALDFARSLSKPSSTSAIRIVTLSENRGKGGAVTHGLRHVRGAYAIFADADGATRFSDLGAMLDTCRAIEDGRGCGVAVGSRHHLVGTEAVVKRSALRNFLMHSFHLLLRMMTPPATGRIRDTQCGFKLFSRAALADIVPYMHSEGWIFDVEMLMLAEGADVPVAEVPVGWKEVTGSKLNVVKDSIGMAWGLAILRAAWAVGVYSRT